MPLPTPSFDLAIEITLKTNRTLHLPPNNTSLANTSLSSATDTPNMPRRRGSSLSDDGYRRALADSRHYSQQQEQEELQQALEASRAQAENDQAREEDDLQRALEASKANAPGYLQSPAENEHLQLCRALEQSSLEHTQRQKAMGAINDDDDEALTAVLKRSEDEWHKCMWNNPPPPEDIWEDRLAAGLDQQGKSKRRRQEQSYFEHHNQGSSFHRHESRGAAGIFMNQSGSHYQSLEQGIRGMSLGEYGNNPPGWGLGAWEGGRSGANSSPLARTLPQLTAPPSRHASQSGTNSPAPASPVKTTRSVISSKHSAAASKIALASPISTTEEMGRSSNRGSKASQAPQSPRVPSVSGALPVSQQPPPSPASKVRDWQDATSTHGIVTYASPVPDSKQSEESEHMVAIHEEQNAAYAASLAADRQKKEDALRKQVEAENAEAYANAEEAETVNKVGEEEEKEEEKEEPDNPEYMKQKRLAFLDRFEKK